jgi:hypothetical protein
MAQQTGILEHKPWPHRMFPEIRVPMDSRIKERYVTLALA